MSYSPLSQTLDGTFLYQCSCGEIVERKRKVAPSLLAGSTCKMCGKGVGFTSHPLYPSWNTHFVHLWPDFEDFLKEALDASPFPGTFPGPQWRLHGRIPGTAARPGNVMWIKPQVFDTLDLLDDPDMNEHRKELLEDPEFKQLWLQAHKDLTNPDQQDTTSFLMTLDRLEKEYTHEGGDLEDRQRAMEEAAQEFAEELARARQDRLLRQGRGSQTFGANALRKKLVPYLAARMEENYNAGMRRTGKTGSHLALVNKVLKWVPFEIMAHIAVTVTMDSVGRGNTYHTPYAQVLSKIGQRINHQAFLQNVADARPDLYQRIKRRYLDDSVKGYSSKIINAKKVANNFEYFGLDVVEQVQLGDWVFANLQSLVLWFETITYITGKGNAKKRQLYLGLSEEGLKHFALIQRARLDAQMENWPMVCPPRPWGGDQPGGYLKLNRKTCKLVHNNTGTDLKTELGEEALAALNGYQAVPFKLNRFIYGVQKALITSTNSIGAFKSYEKDSWMDQNQVLIDPEVWDLPRVDGQPNPETKKAKRQIRDMHARRLKAEKMRQAPERVLSVAARFYNAERFYMPMYADYRTRMYYLVDTLTPQGADYQKALLLFADGNPVTDANRELVRKDLLITLATQWAGEVEGTHKKSDKLSLEEREEFGRKLVEEGAVAAADPLSTAGRAFWTGADEPFQFLATLREYYEIFIMRTKNVAEVNNGRDASNSGMQLQGAFLRDHTMCKYTNVLPSHEPQDAYELVAIEARKLIGEEGWVALRVAGCIEGAEKAQQKRLKKDPNYVPTVYDFTFDVAQEWITRKVVKRPVMCTAYGASWKSKNQYVSDELDALYLKMFGEQGRKPTVTECKVVTDAVIAGQELAFPRQAEINNWFKSVAKAALDRGQDYVTWETVTGSRVVQEFREHVTVPVMTHGMGGAKYDMKLKKNGRIQGGHEVSISVGRTGKVITSKSQSALAANWTHSQDASVLQAAWEKMPQEHIFIVHDCAYAPAGKVGEMVNALKLSFLRVAGSNALDVFPTQNGVEDVIEPLEKGDVNLFDCLKSDYMFS